MSEMRFTSSQPLGDSVIRAMHMKGGVTVRNMRGSGFRLMQENIDNDGFRAATPLPENSQRIIDQTVLQVGIDRLTVVADILAAGLKFTLPDPLSVTQVDWYKSNKVGNARKVMSPETRGENFLPDILGAHLPVYLTISQFELDIRTLRQSQRVGMPLDTANIASGTRAVNESLEDAMLNGAQTLDGNALKVGSYAAPGLLNATGAETKALATATWDATPVGSSIFADVQAMIALLVANKKFGPYALYTGTTVGAYLDQDYDTTSGSRGLTIRERLLKIPGLNIIKTADLMPAANVLLVQLTSDVVDIVYGQAPTVIPWTSVSGFTFYNMIMAIMIPRVKQDYNGKTGICVGTIA